MNERNGYSGGYVLLAFLGGAAAGAAAGLLLAPRSGAETRRAIADRTRSGADKARRLPGAVRSAAGAAREAFSDEISTEPKEDARRIERAEHH